MILARVGGLSCTLVDGVCELGLGYLLNIFHPADDASVIENSVKLR